MDAYSSSIIAVSPRQKRIALNMGQTARYSQCFAENVSWIGVATNVVKPCDAGRDGVAGTVERQSVVALL